MRVLLAIQCFFALLFGRALPVKALPPPQEPEDKRLERERLGRELEDARRDAEELIALGARVTATSSSGDRTLPVEEFFLDYYETVQQEVNESALAPSAA